MERKAGPSDKPSGCALPLDGLTRPGAMREDAELSANSKRDTTGRQWPLSNKEGSFSKEAWAAKVAAEGATTIFIKYRLIFQLNF